VEIGAGAAAKVSPMMAANKPACKSTMEESTNQNSQMLMIVSQGDLERVVQKAIGELLDQRENKPEVFLTAEETAKRLKVDRSTLWRWNKEGYLVSTKVGSKVRYKLSDVESIQKGELL
jgi:excisionase family DNA binding protein